MKKKFWLNLRVLVTNIVIVCSLTGCAIKQLELTESGFLSSYSDLDYQDEEPEGMHIYKNSDVDIAERYSSILIAPVEFKLDPMVKEHEMEYEDRIELSNHFHEQLLDGLMENYEIAEEPGEDVLLLRTAITDILSSKVLLNLHWATTLHGAGIGGASLEAELVDSLTGEQVFVFVDARKGKTALNQPKHLVKNYKSGLSKWGHVKGVMTYWVEIIVENLNEFKEDYTEENNDDLLEVEP